MTLDEARAAIRELASGVPDVPGRIHLDLSGELAAVRIDNPDARNAITLGMMGELVEVVSRLQDWRGGLVLLSADGPVFCSGGHLGQVRRAVQDPAAAIAMARSMAVVLDAFLDLPQISVAAVGGAAIGGGAEICTAADFRTGGPKTRIHFVHAALGIAPGWGGTARLATHIGERAALRVLACADSMAGEDLVRVGLLDEIGPSVEASTEALLASMRRRPAGALRAVKAQIVAARHRDPLGAAAAFAGVWGGPDHLAALARVPAAQST